MKQHYSGIILCGTTLALVEKDRSSVCSRQPVNPVLSAAPLAGWRVLSFRSLLAEDF